MKEQVELTTMCLVWDRENNKVLMINRQDDDWKGYAPPGGHVEFPESLAECAVREVKEETGIDVWDLSFKGLVHFVGAKSKERYMVFNYITEKFAGELCSETCEGKAEWISIDDIDKIPLAPGVKDRFELFFKDTPSEMHIIWDDKGLKEVNKIYL
jgi:ADP-ribose pyrophosphatase